MPFFSSKSLRYREKTKISRETHLEIHKLVIIIVIYFCSESAFIGRWITSNKSTSCLRCENENGRVGKGGERNKKFFNSILSPRPISIYGT